MGDGKILHLLKEYNQTSRLLTDWQGEDYKSWRGVTCSPDGRVTELWDPFSIHLLHLVAYILL